MWPFKKKVSREEFCKFKKRVRKSIRGVRKDNHKLEKQLKLITKVTFSLLPLSRKFINLQSQFTEIIKQFNSSTTNKNVENSDIVNLKTEQISENNADSYKNSDRHLTPLEQKGLIYIGRLQNEAGSQHIPVKSLTTNLYPDRISRKIKTTVSNILKKLADKGLVIRERQGNHWYVGLSNNGFLAVKKLLNQNQLTNLLQIYR